jgi:16S rRNA (guanine527-N7)-methyltransferase
MNRNKFNKHLASGLTKIGLDFQQDLLTKYWLYMKFLLAENKKYNLTGITEPEKIITKHFLDSLSLIKVIDFKDEDYVLDVGTGAGFPGLVLKIMFPDLKMVLIDSTLKKVNFLTLLLGKLEIKNNIQVFHKRAEELGVNDSYRESFDWVISRAVAPLNILCEYTIPFLKHGGRFIAQKGGEVKNEIIEAERTIEILGAEFYDVVSIDLPYADVERCLVIINKIRKTPSKYPRRAGIPKQSPISN